ncbi:hypothetical protein HAX54_019277 [Datura stramonium]|uniref:RNA-dependent RNA polymerase n=1 Tax=Datura stramonium TaxID=4076 RepID=A0ABS8S436_DATST|nr:hypothetical protein [Datura stramonium]
MGKTIQVRISILSAEVVKSFLEKHTGNGTVCALEVKQSRGGSRAFAKVQFVDSTSAEKIIYVASKRLYFGSSYLKAWEMKTDIVQLADISDYKLQLSYENIWQVVLHRPYGQYAQFLLIQLSKVLGSIRDLKTPVYSFFKETPDDQWRTNVKTKLLYRLGFSFSSLKIGSGSHCPAPEGVVVALQVIVQEVNVSNRVIRNYSEDIDNFLRVSFVDEEWEKLYSARLITKSKYWKWYQDRHL